MKRIAVIALSIILALTLATPMALGQVGQGSKASKTTEKLAAAWTQWAYSKPAADSPLIGGDPSYSAEQCDGTPVSPTPGETWFLAGTTDGSEVTRTCTAPARTPLFFPVVSASFFITSPPEETEEMAQEFVDDFMAAVDKDPAKSIVVTVDGKEINSDLIVQAATRFFTVTFPEDNIFAEFNVPAGEYPTITNGLWVALPPLSKGTHTIHFGGNFPDAGFKQDNTYKLTVK